MRSFHFLKFMHLSNLANPFTAEFGFVVDIFQKTKEQKNTIEVAPYIKCWFR